MAKQGWNPKRERIAESYPEVLDVDWSSVFSKDPDAFTKLLGEVIKSEGRGSKPGKRPQLKRSDAEVKLAKIAGEDFSEHDFYTTFKAMCGTRSLMHVANKTNLSKSYVQRLLNGTGKPSLEAMESIAKAFGREPSYFIEYRIAHVVSMVQEFLYDSPETSAAWYLRFKGNSKLRIK